MVPSWAASPAWLFVLPLPGRPFRDDTEAASETLGFDGLPPRSTIMAAIGLCGLKLGQNRIE
jgi:hypothetical protein